MSSGHISTRDTSLREAPFLTTMGYQVWMRLPGQDWRLYSDGFTEHRHAVEDKDRLERGIERHVVSPREVRIARKTTVVEWLDD